LIFWTVGVESAKGSDPTGGVDVAALFDAHGAFVLRCLVRLVSDESVAEDIAQEVFLIAHRRRHELDAERNLAAWLYRVAVNVAWRHKRSFARRARLRDRAADAPLPVDDPGDPERLAADRDHARKVRRCLAHLPPSQREVFVLFELEDKSGEQVAQLLGVPIATVWTRLFRARDRFRKAWQTDGGTDG
jgi:RNA polymerase sigma-70 factor (ECF subfamily)